jgi:hypothetical protein
MEMAFCIVFCGTIQLATSYVMTCESAWHSIFDIFGAYVVPRPRAVSITLVMSLKCTHTYYS